MAVSKKSRETFNELHNPEKYPEASDALSDLNYELAKVNTLLEIMYAYDPDEGKADYLLTSIGVVNDMVYDLWCAVDGYSMDRLGK